MAQRCGAAEYPAAIWCLTSTRAARKLPLVEARSWTAEADAPSQVRGSDSMSSSHERSGAAASGRQAASSASHASQLDERAA
jgi:hypothetical protein